MFRLILLSGVACIALSGAPQAKKTKPPTEGATKLLVSSIDSRDLVGVRIAFEQGADANQGDRRTPIRHALDSYLFAGYTDPKDPEAEVKKKAERNKTFEIIKFLFTKGAKLQNDEDELFTAVTIRDKPFFEYLLTKGLNPHGKFQKYNLLQLAYVYKSDQIISVLEKRGVPKPTSNELPGLKLMRAFHAGDGKELSRLLSDEKIDVDSFDPNETTVFFHILKFVSWVYNQEMLYTVLQAKPNWNLPSKAEDDFGQYPLHLLANQLKYYDPSKHPNIPGFIEMAIQKMGANPNVIDGLGATPLHRAAEAGSEEAVEILLKNGANPRIRDKRFNFPSAVATKPEIVRSLKKAEEIAFLK